MTDSLGEAKTARQWAQDSGIPYTIILSAIKDGRLDAMRFSPRGQFYVLPESMKKFFEESRTRAREE